MITQSTRSKNDGFVSSNIYMIWFTHTQCPKALSKVHTHSLYLLSFPIPTSVYIVKNPYI